MFASLLSYGMGRGWVGGGGWVEGGRGGGGGEGGEKNLRWEQKLISHFSPNSAANGRLVNLSLSYTHQVL